MSRKPNAGEVEKLRYAAIKMKSIALRRETLRAQKIAIEEELDVLSRDHCGYATEVLELLQNMDVAKNGNNGWERRVLWFLAELVTQSEQYGRDHP